MDWTERRRALVETLTEREQLSPETRQAMAAVPRHEFVPESKRTNAYEDRPLPIGEGQTISAPHMVAIMTDLLDLSGDERILEIGTGCGYHAAVTAEVVGGENVYSVEYHEPLAAKASETLTRTGYPDVSIRCGDGRRGWDEHEPYDRIYLTCAASDFPDALIGQVRDGGMLLGPIGHGSQILTSAKKQGGTLTREEHGYVRFVPLK